MAEHDPNDDGSNAPASVPAALATMPPATSTGEASTIPSPWQDAHLHPKQIGAYRILAPVGQGGMGIVYRAEQQRPIRRTVALKIIKLGMDTREVIARFEAERQALAVMDHPNVAKVFDAGATETGRPYFVMEYVSGEPITTYCDRHNLSLRKRLELFIAVCEAVQHAHTKGIIHRDLKPSNVLVALQDGKPVPKVIDFGVAKATQARLTERTMFTEHGIMIGTPEYMSPEQAEMGALDIDTRSDVYSLGVVLYELLVGALPFDSRTLRRAAYQEMQRLIRELDPPRPSTRLTSLGAEQAAQVASHRGAAVLALAKELRHELEWIPLKAMRKDRTERYRTAGEMADDLRNYLSGRPLIAAPESSAYRLRKFLGRNRGAVIAAASVVLALLAGMAATTAQAVRATRAERRAVLQGELAQRRFDDVRELANRFMFDFHAKIENLPGAAPAIEALVSTSQQYLDRISAEGGTNDKELMLELATAYKLLGDIQGNPQRPSNLGDVAGAVASYQKAYEILSRLQAADPEDETIESKLGTVESHWADVLDHRGERQEARKRYERSIEHFRRGAELGRPRDQADRDIATSTVKIGDLLIDQQDVQGALQKYQEAGALMGQAHAAVIQADLPLEPSDVTKTQAAQRDLMIIHNKIGDVLLESGKPAEALGEYQQGLKTAEASHAAHPNDAVLLRDLCISHEKLAKASAAAGNAPAAVAHSEKLLDIAQRWLDADSSNIEARRGLARAHEAKCMALLALGNKPQALASYRTAADVFQQVAEIDRNSAEAMFNSVTATLNVSILRRQLDDPAGARDELSRKLPFLESYVAQNPAIDRVSERLSVYHQQIGGLLTELGDHEAALQSHRKALAVDRRRQEVDPDNLEITRYIAVDLAWIGEAQLKLAEVAATEPERLRHLSAASQSCAQSVQMLEDLQRREALPGSMLPLLEEVRGLLKRSERGLAKATTMPATAPVTSPQTQPAPH